MTFLQHLEELRRIFIKSIIAILVGAAFTLAFSPKIYQILKQPLQAVLPPNSHFIVTTPFEAYLSYFKIALVFGLFLSAPLLFYFFWSFIAPGLQTGEKKGIIPIALICGLLFSIGSLFGYFIVFPPGFEFAVKILGSSDIVMFPKMSDYLSLSLRLLLAFGLCFELPLILYLLGKFRLISSSSLRKARKYVIVAIFLLSGLLTPGDYILTQAMMALPLMLLYEVGILLVGLTQRQN